MSKLSVEIPFSGFYETFHNAMFDDWLEYETEVLRDDHGATDEQLKQLADKYYRGVNWQGAHIQYAKEYCEALCAMVADESREYKEDSTGRRYLSEGLKLDIEFEEMTSPRFYNFETDRIYGKVSIEQLQYMLDAIPADTWATYVKDNFTSYDGFLSYHSNNASEWPIDLAEWGEARLGALMQAFLIHILGDEYKVHDVLSWEMMENARCNGFIDGCIWANASEEFKQFADSLRKDEAA